MTQRQLTVTVTNPHSPTTITDENGQSARTKHSFEYDADTFSWKSDYGDIEIDFDPAHYPFTTRPPYTAKKGKWTTPVTVNRGKAPDSYKYTMRIPGVDPDDPIVIIDKGTLVDGGRDSDPLKLLSDSGGAKDSAKELLNAAVSVLKSAQAAKDGPIFFKDGINLISVEVDRS